MGIKILKIYQNDNKFNQNAGLNIKKFDQNIFEQNN